MKPPDKLYVSQLIYETWQYQTPDPDDETQVEYIRKDALLEWAKEMKTANETYVDKDEPEATQWYKHGAYHICNELIDKLDSL